MAPSPKTLPTEKDKTTQWIWKDGEMVYKQITFIPGLYHLFDNILVNAAVSHQEGIKYIDVKFDIGNSKITVLSNTATTVSLEDFVKKINTYHNWYGDNVFWSELKVECQQGHKKYTQVFTNMREECQPTTETSDVDETWTMVSFIPDCAKCGEECLVDDTAALLKRRVVDVAGCLGKFGKVKLDGEPVQLKTFEDYVNLYIGTSASRLYKNFDDNWEVCVCLSDGQFKQASFVNYMWTRRGGSHVDRVTTMITDFLADSIPADSDTIKRCFWVFVNAPRIDNPTFDSQTKDNMITADKMLSKLKLKSWFSSEFKQVDIVSVKAVKLLFYEPKVGEKLEIESLEDAHFAGTDKACDCTLILTEGESASKIALDGLSIVGQNYYGVYPLDGKLLNVRRASAARLRKSNPIQNIKKILGLQDNKPYDNVDDLRYGHLLIMADQDHDGNHVRGLIINFIHTLWPSLLRVPNFMRAIKSPIVRASHENDVLYFYTMPDYEEWQVLKGKDVVAEYSIKYFKGLGASEDKETSNYFDNLGHHTVNYIWADTEDDDAIDLAFSKQRTEDRKNWLKNYQVGTTNYSSKTHIRLKDFIDKDMKQYFLYDLKRSIPSMVDGLKPGQRKILHAAFTMPLPCKENDQIDLEVFAGYVRDTCAYRHGVEVICGVVVNMARNYVGSNNISLLHPVGRYGSREEGGKDVANYKYIKTRLSTTTPYIYLKRDECILSYLIEDGKPIQPTWFLPIIPMVLVNGCRGIGTGWNTHVPNHDPRVIIDNIKKMLRQKEMVAMQGQQDLTKKRKIAMDAMDPWYEGFSGTIKKSKKNQYTTYGRTSPVQFSRGLFNFTITELPIGKWTKGYNEFLKKALEGETPFIQNYRHFRSSKNKVQFNILLNDDQMRKADEEGIVKKFKLTTKLSTNNMYLYDENGKLKRYGSSEQILEEFVEHRLGFYEKRRLRTIFENQRDCVKLENQIRLRCELAGGQIILHMREHRDICEDLMARNYQPLPKEKEEELEKKEMDSLTEFGYLVTTLVPVVNKEELDELKEMKVAKEKEIQKLKNASCESMWLEELEVLAMQLNVREREREGTIIFQDEKEPSDDENEDSDEEDLGAMQLDDEDESYPEIAEVPVKKASAAKRGFAAAGPQWENKKKQRHD